MVRFKISPSSYKVGNKWVASGVFLVDWGFTQEDINVGPTEPTFDSQEEANRYVPLLAKDTQLFKRLKLKL